MNDRRQLAALAFVLAASVLAFVTLRREPGPDVPPRSAPAGGLPAEYLGRWSFGGTSGGIEGREVAVADGSWIVITAENTLERYSADGRLASTERFEPKRGPSIFSGSDAWILGGSDGIERVIQVHAEGVLTISDNVYDGFGSTYTRNR